MAPINRGWQSGRTHKEQFVARLFRFVEKKRGQRRTGSNLVGSLGEAVFCGCLFLLGTLLLSVIVASQLVQPDPSRFALGVGGWLLVLVTSSSIVLGGGGLIWTVLRIGTSAERRSALARRASEIDLIHDAAPRPRNYPTLPPIDGLMNSPGIQLAYRLPASQTPGWQLLAATIFAMVWNLVVCVLTVSVISNHIAGRHDWLLTTLLVPFWYVCYWSIRALLQLVMVHSGTGHTTVEVSELPLIPGRACQAVVSQQGNVLMKSLRLCLVCEEEATFTQGTDIRTEVREVFREICFERQNFRIEPGVPVTDTCTVTVPAKAMHSFQSPHAAVRWKLVVQGTPEGWPPFERGFPVVVFPGEATMRLEPAARSARNSSLLAAPLPAGARA